MAAPLDNETRMVLKSVSERYSRLGNWTATFVQETTSVGLGTATVAEGQFHFERPSKFRYSLMRSEASDFISDGSQAWHIRYLEGRAKPAVVRRIKDLSKTELDRYLIFARGLGQITEKSEKRLAASYELKGKSSAEEIMLEMKPRNTAQIAKITLIFKNKNDAPYRIVIEDVLGTRTSVTVNSFEKLKKSDPKLFKADYPAGSKVEDL